MCVAGKVSDSGKVFCLSALELECVERKKDQAWLGSFLKITDSKNAGLQIEYTAPNRSQ